MEREITACAGHAEGHSVTGKGEHTTHSTRRQSMPSPRVAAVKEMLMRKGRDTFAGLLVAVVVTVVGCAPPPSACVPGEVRACPCGGGQTGSQTCSTDGASFGACAGCAAVPDGGWSVCTPNTTRSCICTDGASIGLQQCNPTGTDYSVCGSCSLACNAPLMRCSGFCVNTTNDNLNCGRCGNACARGFACFNSACSVDPQSRWIVTAVSATMRDRDCSGNTWDALGGLPDPRFCMTLDGAQTCTESIGDTTMPRWTMNMFPATAPANLVRGAPFLLRDDDVDAHDTLCSGNFTPDFASFETGLSTITCRCGSDPTPVHTISLTLRPL